MQVSLNPKQFLPRLKAVAALRGRSYPHPILETVQMEGAENGGGWLRATHLNAGAELQVPLIRVKRPGTVQLPLRAVTKALAGARAACVDIEVLAPDTLPVQSDARTPCRKIVVGTPRSSVTLPAFDPEYFPVFTRHELPQHVELPAWRLMRLITRTVFASDENATRYALGGCAFEFEDNAVHGIATDGHCLVHAREHATGTGLWAPKIRLVGDEQRPLAPAVSGRLLRTLTNILATMENAALTLGFSPEGRFQVQARGLFFHANLLEGRFPPWKDDFPEPSPSTAQVSDPTQMLQVLRETTRFTIRGSRTTELRLQGQVLKIVVDNEEASTTRELFVKNLSERPEEEASVVIDPLHLLGYLRVQTQPFLLSFPPTKGGPLCCSSEGCRFLMMPLVQAETPETGAPEAEDGPEESCSQEEELPGDEALSA